MRLMHEGAFSTQIRTIFPSLTIPSHVAEVTGTTVDHHGVPANDFYDHVTNKIWVFPPDGSMLTAEPIWTTATRESVRTEVYDWPLSQMQTGPNAAAYFNPKTFDGKLTNLQRLDRIINAYQDDRNEQSLRLVMGYIEGTDTPGHKFGPDSVEIDAMVQQVDTLLQYTFEKTYREFQLRRTSPSDTFYFLITTDHGMASIKTLIRLPFLLDLPASTTKPPATMPADGQADNPVIVTSGPIGNIYLPTTLSSSKREEKINSFLNTLKQKSYLRAYRQQDLPANWHYQNPTRIGDIVVVLNEGYAFSNSIPLAEYPVDKSGPLGMHGYVVEENPDMEGVTFMWRSKGNWGGRDLGVVHSTQFHATVAKWLGIEPATGADLPISGVE